MNPETQSSTNVYSRLLLPVIVSAGSVGLSIGLIVPLTSIVLEQRGVPVVAIGMNATIYSLAVLLAGPFFPRIVQRVGMLRAMVAGALLSGVFVFGLWLEESLWYWYLLRFCLGVTGGIHWVSSEAWINAMAPEHSRGRIVGAYATIWSMGIAAGPVLLKFIGVEGAMPFVISGLIMGGASIPLLLVPKDGRANLPSRPFRVVPMAAMAPLAAVAGFISGFLETAVLALLPVYGLRSGIATSGALILVSVFAVGSFVWQPFVGWVVDKVSFKMVALLVAAISVIAVPLVHFNLKLPLIAGVLLFVWGGSVGAYYTLGMINIGQVFKGAELTAASSMFVMAYTFGMVVGPLMGSSSMHFIGPAGFPVVVGMAPLIFFPLALKRTG
ncbi:MAG: MFS transporter [Thermodesulfobacteriota bacterium]